MPSSITPILPHEALEYDRKSHTERIRVVPRLPQPRSPRTAGDALETFNRVRLTALVVTAWQGLATRDTSGGASAEVVSHSSGSNRAQVSLCFRQLENSKGPSPPAAQRHRSLAGQAR